MAMRLRPSSAVGWTAGAVLSLASLTAEAGSLELRDRAGLFDETQAAALRREVSALPFDVRVLTTSEHEDRASLDRATGLAVSGPNVLVVGLDPQRHRTSVHFGTGLRVPTTRYHAVQSAGSASFRGGDWARGVTLIARAAQEARGGAVERAEAPGFPWGLVLFGVTVVGVIAVASRFLRARAAAAPYAGDAYRSPAYPPNAGGGYGPGVPGYGPGSYGYGPAGYGGGMGGVGTHLAAAGLGGLAGYAVGRALDDNDGSSHAGVSDAPQSYDAGGSTDDWGGNDGGNDGGGGDFGGSDGGDW